jgi:tyrosinase
LARFERQLQIVSKDPALYIPYWDYYAFARMPWEFTNSPSTNPLYRDRTNTDVTAASLAPFSDSIISFPRYWSSNPFETSVESAPHNTFHSIVGGVMWTMNAPLDPIFWLHHCYIDRLWSAWIAAGGGHRVPATTSTYWSGKHVYRPDLGMDRLTTRSEESLNYRYQSMALPKSLPASTTTTARAPGSSPELLLASSQPRSIRALLQAGSASSMAGGGFIRTGGRQPGMNMLAQAESFDMGEAGTVTQTAPVRPPIGRFRETGKRKTARGKLALPGVADIPLDETSISAEISMTRADRLILKEIAAKAESVSVNGPPAPSDSYQSARIVLDHVRLTPVGRSGGYFYNVFLNLPASPGTGVPREKLLIGNFGPFDVAGAKHHGDMSQLTFDVTHLIDRVNLADFDKLRISSVRVSGENFPSGRVIQIGEARVEVSETFE